MSWESAVRKFETLAAGRADGGLHTAIVQAVRELESLPARELAGLLARLRSEG
jgi:hypothetical protein